MGGTEVEPKKYQMKLSDLREMIHIAAIYGIILGVGLGFIIGKLI